jgi:hypothetical protein
MKPISDRFKKIIFDRMYKDLSHVEIILHEDKSIWFIDRNEKYWFFELKKSGCLWWRYEFFTNFFSLFSMDRSEFEPIIKEWVDEVLNSKVVATDYGMGMYKVQVEQVLNLKIKTTSYRWPWIEVRVEEILNRKINKIFYGLPFNNNMVEEVLNSKIVSTKPNSITDSSMIYEVSNKNIKL